MEYVELPSRYENVEFEFLGDGTLYRFRLHVFRDMIYATIYADNNLVVAGQRCVNDAWLIPEGYIPEKGNFRFEVNGENYPWWENFGDGVRLAYYSPSEVP